LALWQMLVNEMSCIWKELQSLRLAVTCSTIACTSIKVTKTRLWSQWFYSAYRREYQSKLLPDHLSGEWWYNKIEVHFAEITGDHYLANTHYYTTYNCCLSIFANFKLFIINRDSLIYCCFLSFFYFLSIISIISLKHSLDWEFVYFLMCVVGI